MIPPIFRSPFPLAPLPSQKFSPITRKETPQVEILPSPQVLPSLKAFAQDLFLFISNILKPFFSTKKIDTTEPTQILVKPTHSLTNLKISKEHKSLIKNLLEELATSSVAHLAWNTLRLMKIGKTLKEQVHPFRFLREIYKDPTSKKHLEKLYADRHDHLSGRSQIWKDFSLNLAKNFEDRIDEIEHYLSSFAEKLSLDFSEMQTLQKAGKWKELLLFIVHSKL